VDVPLGRGRIQVRPARPRTAPLVQSRDASRRRTSRGHRRRRLAGDGRALRRAATCRDRELGRIGRKRIEISADGQHCEVCRTPKQSDAGKAAPTNAKGASRKSGRYAGSSESLAPAEQVSLPA
jgi:hypothetical protein